MGKGKRITISVKTYLLAFCEGNTRPSGEWGGGGREGVDKEELDRINSPGSRRLWSVVGSSTSWPSGLPPSPAPTSPTLPVYRSLTSSSTSLAETEECAGMLRYFAQICLQLFASFP